MKSNLMTSRRFAPLFWTQFLSAFNDNFLKNTLVFLILFQVALNESAAASQVTLAGAIFMAPFLFLSALGGQLADKMDKGRMAERLKLAEVGAAVVSVIGMYMESVPVLMFALFLFGVISALFGPIKYGILPDHLERSELPKANAWIEGATFIAILAGTITAGLAASADGGGHSFALLMLIFAAGCYLCSRFIPNTGSKASDLVVDKNILRSTWSIVSDLRQHNRIFIAALINSWFWVVGAIALSIMPTMVKEILGGTQLAITAYLTVFAVFVAVGSGIAAWMSAGRVVLLPAVFGALFVGLFSIDLAYSLSGTASVTTATSMSEFFASVTNLRVAFDFAGMAFFGAFIAVPTFTAIQAWSKEDHRARMIAGANIINAAAMTVSGLIIALFQGLGLSITALMVLMGIANFVAGWAMLKYLPTNPLRDFVSILFRAFHRLEIKGLENVEKAGRAPIIALNHVSLLDGPLAMIITDEEPIFAVNKGIAEKWWAKPFLRYCDYLALDPANPMATRTMIKSLERGQPLVIFPEGRITVTGSLMKVYDGAALVADKTGSMVVPVRIDGLQRSRFSYLHRGEEKLKWFPKVTVTVMPPVKLDVDPELVGRKRRFEASDQLYKVMSNLVFKTTNIDLAVYDRIIEAAKRFGMGHLAVEDAMTGKLSYGKLLTGAAVLARVFDKKFAGEERVGFLMPNANGSVATLLGLMSAGKVPAVLNFTAGSSNLISACKTATLKHVVSSKAFVTQGKLEPLISELEKHVTIIWMEDMREEISLTDKLLGMATKTKPLVKRKANDPLYVLYTSGSEGSPKGVVLTNRNVLANAAQASARIDFNASDKLFNFLPMFHSFGLTVGTILPLVSGVPTFMYPSPLHYRLVPELVYSSNATIMFGTDTFLNGYARTANPYDFRSIRYLFAGAEPVQETTRKIYMEKFGIRILEGYGITETAPVVALNTPLYNKGGSVGKIMPGIEYHLEDVPGVEEGGKLMLKGPNVMAGYLLADKPGQLQPPEDGWYDTGDIVDIDENGFVTIKGRAKRFAKIGGEMISLAAVEALAGKLWPGQSHAVCAIKDAKKGEKLIMLTDQEGATRKEFMTYAKENGAMDLMIPADVVVTQIPVLGSGKVDHVSIAKMVQEHLAA